MIPKLNQDIFDKYKTQQIVHVLKNKGLEQGHDCSSTYFPQHPACTKI